MRIARFDSVGGASGDMILGALAAIGADLNIIENAINAIFPEKIDFLQEKADSHGIHGLRVSVQLKNQLHAHHDQNIWHDAAHATSDCKHEAVHAHHEHDHPHEHDRNHTHAHSNHNHHAHHEHRGFIEITELISNAPIDAKTKQLAIKVFDSIAAAEAKIHGKTKESVHFHEIGAYDSIADILGACMALHQLNIDAVQVGPLPGGVGTIKCAHGMMPNPAPATMLLLHNMQTVTTDEPFELVTPTGAALLNVWSTMLPAPAGSARVVASGFGFGHRALKNRPNILRATLLESDDNPHIAEHHSNLYVLETNLDDCNPQWLGEVIQRLLDSGALDAWLTPIIMKKGRPGNLLSVLASFEKIDLLEKLIFHNTTTFGIRHYKVTRTILDRRFEIVQTPWGSVRVKIGRLGHQDLTCSPEFEDCTNIAQIAGNTSRQIADLALKIFHGKKDERT